LASIGPRWIVAAVHLRNSEDDGAQMLGDLK
jgi:hypothetical protein